MNRLFLPDYNLDITLLGGQSFAWDLVDGTYYGALQNRVISLKRVGDDVFWQTYPVKDDEQFIRKYLRLDTDYGDIINKIKKDKFVERAVQEYPHLRLLKQEFEETFLSYTFSPVKNIPSIRRSIRMMNRELGRKFIIDDHEIFTFPETEVIANTELNKLREFKMGFRAETLKSVANLILSSDISSRVYNLKEDELREKLISVKGVGDKIADCVMVYSLAYDNLTPIDVWGKRFLVKYYGLDPKVNYQGLRKWVKEYFGENASWAGQFLFEYIRKNPDK